MPRLPTVATAAEIRAFVKRPWSEIRAAKEEFFAADARSDAPSVGLLLSESLWADMRAIDPAWPDESQRRDDLDHHLRLCAKLARLAACRLPSRASSKR